jgi:SAM-dependent methyltransferase
MNQEFSYIGNELALFEAAKCWNSYIAKLIGEFISGDVLEVGAGLGVKAGYLWNERVTAWTALEPDPELARKCESRRFNRLKAGYQVMATTLKDIPLHCQYDTILYLDVLEHIENDADEVRLATSSLKIGGFLVVLAPAHDFLFSEFDQRIGHYRRYDVPSLMRLMTPSLKATSIRYVDSVGFFASLANSLLLKQDEPTFRQIKFWDNWLIPLSTYLDPLLRYKFGKSIILVWRKIDATIE